MTVLDNLEKYAKELHRKHLTNGGYRAFEHPSYASAIVIVKDNKVLGMTSRSILRDNSSTTDILDNKRFVEFSY